MCVGKVSVHLQLEMNTLGVLSVPTVKNLYELVRATLRLYFESCLGTYIDMDFFSLFLFGEISPGVCPGFLKPKATYLQFIYLHLFWDN